MGLKEYKRKRNFNKTLEPKGGKADPKKKEKSKKNSLKNLKDSSKYLYVIQKHAARHLHYDLRLEIDNTLKSWAIPKGPHLNPMIKRLAIHVEDHPIEYGNFEGTIPAGEYGAGSVIIWDKGEWIPDNDPIKSYQKGDLTFQIKGKKLKGKWKLIRLHTDDANKKKHWLFFKVNDAEASTKKNIVEDEPLSVLSKKSIDQIAKSKDVTKGTAVQKAKRTFKQNGNEILKKKIISKKIKSN